MPGTLKIDGIEYQVLDNLRFQASAGVYAKEVKTPDGPRVAVRAPGERTWRFWTASDQVRLRGHVTGQRK